MHRPLVRLPDHLGDRVMALPALRALTAAHGPLALAGRGDWAWLLAELPGCGPAAPGEAPPWALLLKPSLSAALDVRGAPRRIGAPGDLRRALLTDPVPPAAEHRVNAYLRLAAAAGALPADGERAPALRAALPAPPTPRDNTPLHGHDVLLLVGSATGRVVDWPGLRGLADALAAAGRRAVLVPPRGGEAATAALAGPHPVALGAAGSAPTVPEVAALARSAGAVVGADSGLSHVAAAARRGARARVDAVLVILGSTEAARTAPPGARTLRGAALPCAPCLRRSCAITASGTPPCLDLPIDVALRATLAALARAAA